MSSNLTCAPPSSPSSRFLLDLISLSFPAMLSLLRFAPLVLLQLITLPTFSAAYSWVFNASPQQCSNLSISITGSGTPPYRVLIIPFGPTPLPNDTEVRRIVDHSFEGDSTSTSFAINYPENSQFVAVVSRLFSPSIRLVLCPRAHAIERYGEVPRVDVCAPSGHALFSEHCPPPSDWAYSSLSFPSCVLTPSFR